MANIPVGSVYATFRADNRQFIRATEQNVQAIRNQQRATRQAANEARRSGQVFQRFGRQISGAFAAIGAGIIVRGFTRSIASATEFGAEMVETARRTGLLVEELQVLGQLFESEGATLQNFTTFMRTFQRAVTEGQDGLTTYVRAFNRLGIDINSTSFNLLTSIERVSLLNERLQGLSETAQSATLQQIGGRGGIRLLATFQLTPEEFQAEIRRQLRIAAPLTAQQSRDLKALRQSFTDLGNAVSASSRAFIARLAPAVKEATDSLVNFVSGSRNFFGTIFDADTTGQERFLQFVRLLVRINPEISQANKDLINSVSTTQLPQETLFNKIEIFAKNAQDSIRRLGTAIEKDLTAAIARAERSFDRINLNEQLENAFNLEQRVQIRVDFELADVREQEQQLQSLIAELQLQLREGTISGLDDAGIADILRRIIQARKEQEELRRYISESEITLDQIYTQLEQRTIDAIRLNAQTDILTRSVVNANQAALDSLRNQVAVAERQVALNQIDTADATTILQEAIIRAGPAIEAYQRRIDDLTASVSRFEMAAAEAVVGGAGFEVRANAFAQLQDAERARDQAIADGPDFVAEQIALNVKLAELNRQLAESNEAVGRSFVNLNEDIQGFDFDGIVRGSINYLESLRRQNEEIGLQAGEIAELRARRQIEAAVQAELFRLTEQRARAEADLRQAQANGDAQAIANARIRLQLTIDQIAAAQLQQQNVEDLIADSQRRARAYTEEGERLRNFKAIAEEIGDAFGTFTGDVIRNFNEIDDAARALGRSIVNNLIKRLIVNPVSNFFGAALGSLIPGLQTGGLGRGLTLVGEAGPELVDFRRPGRVYSNEDLANALDGSGGGNVFNFSPIVNSSDPAAVNRALAEAYPIFETRVLSRLQLDARRRSSLRQSIRG